MPILIHHEQFIPMNTIYTKSRICLRAVITTCVIACMVNVSLPDSAHAGWRDLLDKLKSKLDVNHEKKLTPAEIVAGLKEALRVGTQKSIDILGKPDGFFKDQSVKILMPEKLEKAEKLLRRLGQDRLADNFIETMNRAAEKSVHTTFTIFVKAIKQMTINDVMKIYNGREDEATRYFQTTQGQEIHNAIFPLVKDATEKTGVTSTYKEIANKIHKLHLPVDVDMPDLDNYVTQKTMDGIFLKLAKEEALIRKDPEARTTEILKKVFSK